MKTKILIVDDSRVFRSVVEESLSGESDIEVIGSVRNGIKAIEFISSNPPDLITLDVEMPDMDGLETLKAIQEINRSHAKHGNETDPNRRNETKDSVHPIGVIMISSFTSRGADITIKALEAGAFDFITKPEGKSIEESMKILRRQLLVKIRYFASRLISSHITGEIAPKNPPVFPTEFVSSSRIKAILIAVSTGGPRALAEMMPRLCEKTDIPIFIVQHMPPTFTQSLAASLNLRCRYTVEEGKDNEVVHNNHVYIAPGGKHLVLRRKSGEIITVTNMYPPENGCRPSADMLFRSAVSVWQGDLIAIILTGMGTDGTKGAAVLKKAGAYIIVQDEESSIVWGMPRSVKDSGNADEILSLSDIPDAVGKRIRGLEG